MLFSNSAKVYIYIAYMYIINKNNTSKDNSVLSTCPKVKILSGTKKCVTFGT